MAQTTGGVAKKTVHLGRDMAIVAAVLIAGLAFVAGWYVSKHQSNSKSNSNLQTYKNTKYGFQLQYPDSWSSPQFTYDTSQGKRFVLKFTKDNNVNITLLMDQADPKNKVCNGSQCYDRSATISDNVKAAINNNKSTLAIKDSSSYANIVNTTQPKLSLMNVARIVSLPKLNVSAATVVYQINKGTNVCPKDNQFAQNSNGSCIEKSDYSTANQVLASIKPI